jgi:D-alanine-D-alanine ligase-like ATP-grasp enzyme/acylphosphatase
VENSYSSKLSTRESINTLLIANELKARNYQVEWINKRIIRFRHKGRYLAFRETHAPYTSMVSVHVCVHKAITATLLRRAGLEVADGRTFFPDSLSEASAYASQLASPVVVKPQAGGKGKGVTVGVSGENAFIEAFKFAGSAGGRVLVERQFEDCVEARFLVAGGRCVAVVGRRPPMVVGNGVDSVAQLIDARNQFRSANPHLRNRLIELNPHRISFISQQGYQLSDVPKPNHEIIIDLKAGFSTGADSFDLTDYVHPSFIEVAARGAAAVFDADPAGVDILVRDFRKPAVAGNYIICEINTVPGIGGHHFPVYGTPRNVASAIVDHALRVAASQQERDKSHKTAEKMHIVEASTEHKHERKVHVMIAVRGVGYRRWLKREALYKDLDGWVRNQTDGMVEAVLAGPAEKVGAMLLRCQEGPLSANVERTSFRLYHGHVAPGFALLAKVEAGWRALGNAP